MLLSHGSTLHQLAAPRQPADWLFGVAMGGFFDIRTRVIAILGSVVVLLLYGLLTRGSRGRA